MSEYENKNSFQDSLNFPAKRILVPVDGSDNSLRAAKVAISLAKELHAELFVLNAVVIPAFMIGSPIGADSYPIAIQEYYDGAEKEGSIVVEGIATLAKSQDVSVQSFVERSSGSVVHSIINKASEENIDLIVIGTRGLGGFKRLLLGSVSSGVVTHARCNVLVVR